MYRFLLHPKWLGFHLLVLAGIVVMVNMSLWQFDRLDARREFNQRIESRIDEPVTPIDDLLAEVSESDVALPEWDTVEWRMTEATGRYLPDEQFVVVNRSQNGRPGDNVVIPLELPDGRILLVNRGFVPLSMDIPEIPGGAGETVTVRGLARVSQVRRTGQLSDPAEGRLAEVQRIDLDRLAPQLPGAVVPVYVDLLSSDPTEMRGTPEAVLQPDLSDGAHLSYAVQWAIFALAVAAGWVFAIRRSISTRRATRNARGDGVSDDSSGTTSVDPPPSGDGARAKVPN